MLIHIRDCDDEINMISRDPNEFVMDLSEIEKRELICEYEKVVYKKGKLLLEKHGLPDIIHYIPSERTDETLKQVLSDIPKDDTSMIKIIYDVDTSRYFRMNQRDNSENKFESMRKVTGIVYEFIEEKRLIWCLTPTILYNKLLGILNIPILHTDHFIVKKQHKPEWCSYCNKSHYM